MDGGRWTVDRGSFFELIFFEERREWAVDRGSFFELIFFEERKESGSGERCLGAGERGSGGAGVQGMDSFSNSFFSRNERSGPWTVDGGSFFELTFFEDRMVGWLKIED